MSFAKLAKSTLGYIVKHKSLWGLGVLYTVLQRSVVWRNSTSDQDLISYLWCGAGALGTLALPWIAASIVKGFQNARARRKTNLLFLLSETRIYHLRLLGLLAILGIALIVSLSFLRELSNELLKTYPSVELLSPAITWATHLIGYLTYSLIILAQIGIVTQDLGVGPGIRNAWRFMNTRFLQVIAVFALVTPVSFLTEFVFSLGKLSGGAAFISGLIYLGMASLISLLNIGLFTISYLQLRNRRI